MSNKTFTIYRIYYGDDIVYVGQTAQPLQNRLRGHFFKARMMRVIDIELVSKIENAVCPTQADMNVYERYYIELLKPMLNSADKDWDELTVRLPELAFQPYDPPLMEKWRKRIALQDEKEAQSKEQERHILMAKAELRRLRRAGELSEDEYFERLDRLSQPESEIYE